MNKNTDISIEQIREYANSLLSEEPTPGVVLEYLIRKNILSQQTSQSQLNMLEEEIMNHPHVLDLGREQKLDGGWGMFHSQSSTIKQKIGSTEVAIERGVMLGLTSKSTIFRKTVTYLENLLDEKIPFPDYEEKNNRWILGKQLFIASSLAWLDPAHRLIIPIRQLWRNVLDYTFQTGEFEEEREIEFHKKNTGASVKNSYLLLNHKYQVILIGSGPSPLPQELEKKYLDWIWQHPMGIGYLNVPLTSNPNTANSSLFERWLSSLELLVQHYQNWFDVTNHSIQWLWNQQISPGRWDFGPRYAGSLVFPLSINWKNRARRYHDWSARILALFSKIV